jgi:hypothetical protein
MVGSGGSDKAAPAPVPAVIATAPGLAMPPEGMHPDAAEATRHCRRLPAAPPIRWRSATDFSWRGERRRVQWMSRVGCRRPALNSGHWLWSDGSLSGLTATIENGVAHPRQYQGVKPPLGGRPLRHETWRRWRPTFGPSAMPGSHEIPGSLGEHSPEGAPLL